MWLLLVFCLIVVTFPVLCLWDGLHFVPSLREEICLRIEQQHWPHCEMSLIAGFIVRCYCHLLWTSMKDWSSSCGLYGDYWRWGERPIVFWSHMPICQKDPSVNVTVQLTAHDPPGLHCMKNRLTSGHTSPTSGSNSFFLPLERPNGSIPIVTQHNMEWHTVLKLWPLQ